MGALLVENSISISPFAPKMLEGLPLPTFPQSSQQYYVDPKTLGNNNILHCIIFMHKFVKQTFLHTLCTDTLFGPFLRIDKKRQHEDHRRWELPEIDAKNRRYICTQTHHVTPTHAHNNAPRDVQQKYTPRSTKPHKSTCAQNHSLGTCTHARSNTYTYIHANKFLI